MADTKVKPDFDQIATTLDGRDITRGYVWPQILLMPQDLVLTIRGGNDLRAYEDLLRDDQVAATFQQRRLAVTSAEWTVDAGGKRAIDKAAADFIKQQLNGIEWDRITEKMLYGTFYGYSVGECLYARDGAQVVLDDIRVRKSRRFRFDGELRMRMLTYDNLMGELLPDRKFWIYQSGADNDDEPYGLGLGHYVYWPVLFKRNGMRFWLIFLEKFGMPTGVGKYPSGTTAEDQNNLLAAVQAIQTDSGVIIPASMQLELLEAARSGTGDYDKLHSRMNEAISKAIVGQTMTADHGSSRSQAQIHMVVRQDLVKSDADTLCASFNNQVVRWLCDWNFPGAAYPRVYRRIEEPVDLGAMAATDKDLASIGFRRKLEDVQETFGGQFDDLGMPAQGQPGASIPSTAFAEGADPRDPVDLSTATLAQFAQPEIGRWMAKIEAMISQAESLEQLEDMLVNSFAELPSNKLGYLMGRAMAAAEAAGRFDVQQTAND
ncbi:DUF935 domain-containing protein [Acidihalobacter prosperus]|uniref:Portal protein n=1 Tax=Acidihalobacter prosperus TaxID=160660 RepID=A0A1A6C8B5_9GAMM|nr:DUF935 family protein [Acidihalobacter prosperus]OBS10796.1 hypothetical protein Thpro_020512 [Acidihalobacter prosperus]